MADQLMDGSKTELILNEQMGQTIVDREINVPQVPRFCLPVFLLENQGAAELSGYHLSIQLWRRCTPCSSNPVSTYHYDIPRESGHPIAICNGWCRTSAPPPPMCLLAEVSLSFFFYWLLYILSYFILPWVETGFPAETFRSWLNLAGSHWVLLATSCFHRILAATAGFHRSSLGLVGFRRSAGEGEQPWLVGTKATQVSNRRYVQLKEAVELHPQ